MMKLPHKVSLGPETCEIGPKVWFLASGFCLLRLGEPAGGHWGNRAAAAQNHYSLRYRIRSLLGEPS